MSKEQLEGFQAAVMANATLQEEIGQQGDNLAGIVAIGEREGYVFSTEDLAAYLESYRAEGGRELSDEELANVAGAGWTGDPTCGPC
jgi:predicted ribosomally synthesized peptide with nif11-like leader